MISIFAIVERLVFLKNDAKVRNFFQNTQRIFAISEKKRNFAD